MRWAGVTEPGNARRSAGVVLRDVMTTRVAATTPDTPVEAAAAVMVEANAGSAVVMQGSFLAGILTERDGKTYNKDGDLVKRFGFHNLGRHSLATFLMD